MAKNKKDITIDEFDKNIKKAKVCKKIAPFIFWGCIIVAVILFYVCFRNSIGNVIDICDKLDKKTHTGEELTANYQELIDIYGEWDIGGSYGGMQITFVNISKALFNSISVLAGLCSLMFFISAFVIGRWFLPKLAEQIKEDNQDNVNRLVIKNNTKE